MNFRKLALIYATLIIFLMGNNIALSGGMMIQPLYNDFNETLTNQIGVTNQQDSIEFAQTELAQLDYSPSAPLYIVGDAELLNHRNNYGWSGTGSVSDPIVITGLNITHASEILIYISSISYSIIIEDNYLRGLDTNYCIYSYNVTSLKITDNTIVNSKYAGVLLLYSPSNGATIHNNTFINNAYGIILEASNGHTITNNTIIHDYAAVGIFLHGSSGNTIEYNEFTNTGIYLDDFLSSKSDNQVSVMYNYVNGKPIGYFQNRANYVLNSYPYGQLIIVTSTNFYIANMNFTSAYAGLQLYYSNRMNIQTSVFNNNGYGIRILFSNDIKIQDSSFNSNSYAIYTYFTEDIFIGKLTASSSTGSNSFTGNGLAVHTHGELNATIIGNSIINGGSGIYVWNKNTNTLITDNIISNNRGYGIHINYGYYFVVFDNTISNNGGSGIIIANSEWAIVFNNDISNNGGYGIINSYSKTGVITDNVLLNNPMYFEISTGINALRQDSVMGNTLNGRPIVYIESATNPTIAADAIQVIVVDSNDVVISDLTDLVSVQVLFSNSVTISNNIFTSEIDYPLNIYRSTNLIINGNELPFGTKASLYLSNSDGIELRNNQLDSGIRFWTSAMDDFVIAASSNTINGKPIIFLIGIDGITYSDPSQVGQIFLINSNNITIENQEFLGYYGIYLYNSDNVNIVNNSFTDTVYGIYSLRSNSISINNNEFTNVIYSISIDFTNHTIIESNTIMNSALPIYVSCYAGVCTDVNVINNYIFNEEAPGGTYRYYFGGMTASAIWYAAGQYMFYNSTIIGNTIENYYGNGIKMIYNYNGLIQDNEIINNFAEGIVLWPGKGTVINRNLISGNGGHGIISFFSDNLNITENLIVNNGHSGIYLGSGSKNATITDNVISFNHIFGITARHGMSFTPRLENPDSHYIAYNIFEENKYEAIFANQIKTGSIVERNDFINNNYATTGISQVTHYTSDITFDYNYYSDWISPDINNDGIVDRPYRINGSNFNADLHPVTSQFHSLLAPTLTTPNGGEKLDGIVTIEWEAALDGQDHEIHYSLFISDDGGSNWGILALDLTELSYSLNTSLYSDGENYLIKVVAVDIWGYVTEDTSDDVFEINNGSIFDNILDFVQSNPKAVAAGLVGVIVVGGVTRVIGRARGRGKAKGRGKGSGRSSSRGSSNRRGSRRGP
ncbi:MAG: right-handed parallel beta-helix repeat-containing protein [Candidatus Heimdallarchaeota archaeon]|nr:right-handed parallel beta-helix repeat-containing protein [Candidatus Heimdallarchaeota archaeon]